LIKASELLIVKRYLKPKRKEGILKVISIFSFLGIGLGVATLIIVMSVMNGFRTDLISKLLLFQPHILVYQFDDYENNKKKIKDILENNQIKITNINLSYQIQSLIISKDINKGSMVRALQKENFFSDKLISKNIIDGDIKKFGNNYISIGSNLSESLGVWVGDKITILSTSKETTPFGNVPKQYTFKIGSVFKTGIYEFDNNYIIIDISSSQDFLSKQLTNRNIEVRLQNPDQSNLAKKILEKNKFNAFSWIDNNKTFYDALLVERNVMFIILTLIIIVAAFNIISGLTILVKNKFEPLNERVPVFEAPFRLTQAVHVSSAREDRETLARMDRFTITGTLDYQACDDRVCFNPQSVPVSYSFQLRPLDTERAAVEPAAR
jgi:lipoprotein-releasing system permease protein